MVCRNRGIVESAHGEQREDRKQGGKGRSRTGAPERTARPPRHRRCRSARTGRKAN